MNVVEEIKEIVAKLDKIDDYNNSLCDKLSVLIVRHKIYFII